MPGAGIVCSLANRLIVQPKYNVNVQIYIPDIPGYDWLDLMAKRKADLGI